ncbi:MAG TPA: phosphoribosylaminoimidazolesuccinocarboxamide synthase, partial [Pseudolysinimonas sp.]
GEHDVNVSFDKTVELVGASTAAAIRDAAIGIYTTAAAKAAEHGLILADTKFEFGDDPDTGELTLADEVLTSDSSRYWDAAKYAAGTPDRLDSFDKQIVRDWLTANWDKTGPPPQLPTDVVDHTAARYQELIDRLTE